MEKLLFDASKIDNRTVTDYMVDGWLDAIGHYRIGEALTALHSFRAVATTEYLVPGHITHHIKVKREEHRALYGFNVPPPPGQRWAVDVIETHPQFQGPKAITTIREQEDRSDPSNGRGA